jgi:hypothetical protein
LTPFSAIPDYQGAGGANFQTPIVTALKSGAFHVLRISTPAQLPQYQLLILRAILRSI